MQTNLLHPAQSCTSSSVTPNCCHILSSAILPPSSFILIILLTLLPMYPSSLHSTSPNHSSLYSFSLFAISSSQIVSLVISFCILSILFFPRVNHSILISITSIFLSCPFVTATTSMLHNIADLTMILYILPFSSAGTFLSHNNPMIFCQEFHPT